MADRTAKNVTIILDRLNAGEADAFADLVNAVYHDVHVMVTQRMRRSPRGVNGMTVQTTAVVHDVLMTFQRQRSVPRNGSQFFALATEVIIRILTDYHRARKAKKRGGGWGRLSLDEVRPEARDADVDEAAEDEASAADRALHALRELLADSPRQAEVASLRVYWQMTAPEVAAALRISESTVNREWSEAKKRLARACAESPR